MKKIFVLIFAVILFLGNGVYGAISLDEKVDRMLVGDPHFTFGLGCAGNPLLGAVWKDGFGYPKEEVGLSTWVGVSYTGILGTPTEEEIRDAVKAIKLEYGEDPKVYELPGYELPKLVRQKINKGMANYFTIGTVALIVPLNFEFGWMWYSDNVRFRLGFGLPSLIAIGINYDF
jgi:hypothetical protein